MSILICGPIDSSGYGQALVGYALSLESVDFDIVLRHIPMSNAPLQDSLKIKELLSKNLNNIDVVFQHNLPSEYSFSSKTLMVAGFDYETNSLPPLSDWQDKLTLMDKIVVPCNHMKNFMPKDLYEKTYVVPHALDVEKYDKEYPKLGLGLNKNTYKFYTIGEFNKRKNLGGLLMAYYASFDSGDNVALIIKTNLGSGEKVQELCEDIKKGLRRFTTPERYPKVILISQFLTEDQINYIHQNCDCFVTSSHGEAFCYPLMDSLGFGNRAIAPNWGCFKDINGRYTAITGQLSYCFGVDNSPKGLYSSNELWDTPNPVEIGFTMRHIYENHKNFEKTEDNVRFIKENYNYKVIGEKLKEIFEN